MDWPPEGKPGADQRPGPDADLLLGAQPSATPAGLRLELAAAVGLLVAVLGRDDPEAVMAAVREAPCGPAVAGPPGERFLRPPGERFLRTTLASWPAAIDAPSLALGRAASAALEGVWLESVAADREPAVVEALFGAYRATVGAVSRRADVPVREVHALVASLCRRARRSALDGQW